MTDALRAALRDLLIRMADDDLVLGHRNSEWTGLGPILEEDIAFASMAQDQLGHAQAYYSLVHTLYPDGPNPDALAFARSAAEFRSCHLVEVPMQFGAIAADEGGDYAFSLVRHWLYDAAKSVRLGYLSKQTAFPQLAELSTKITREHKYHQMHARTWVNQLGRGSEESRLRMQSALNDAVPMALGLFEATDAESDLIAAQVLPSEAQLKSEWLALVMPVAAAASLTWPADPDPTAHLGGRRGWHTEHLERLLAEMTEVFAVDPTASW
jgi:ring-1,2-phenylacetyl-CoA epoxidase subunit PaaC